MHRHMSIRRIGSESVQFGSFLAHCGRQSRIRSVRKPCEAILAQAIFVQMPTCNPSVGEHYEPLTYVQRSRLDELCQHADPRSNVEDLFHKNFVPHSTGCPLSGTRQAGTRCSHDCPRLRERRQRDAAVAVIILTQNELCSGSARSGRCNCVPASLCIYIYICSITLLSSLRDSLQDDRRRLSRDSPGRTRKTT